ncbi:MAG: hypothetical protein WC492_00985 [Candidatus Micrarchaeia archaeon]
MVKAQVSIELIVFLGIMLIITIYAASLLGYFVDSSDLKIGQSKAYWRGTASPIKVNEYGLVYAMPPAENSIEINLSMELINPTNEPVTIRKINVPLGNFTDVYKSNGVYLGKASDQQIVLSPGNKITILLQGFQSGPTFYIPPNVFELNLTFIYDSTLASQQQFGAIPLVERSNRLNDSAGLGSNGCPSGTIPCPDSAHCVPSANCNNGTTCIPPNSICNGTCCTSPQVCFEGACTATPACISPSRICGPDAADAYECCSASQACIDGSCVSCTSPTSTACNQVCCGDDEICTWATSTCVSTCTTPSFLCPAGSSNCCSSPTYSYCNETSGSCLEACTAPSISCGPDTNNITYCCDSLTQKCNSTSKTCQSCASPTPVACNSTCCLTNYDCNLTTSACSCPLERQYNSSGIILCCPNGQIYNVTSDSCVGCAANTTACGTFCCPEGATPTKQVCDTTAAPVACTDCCPGTSYMCNNEYCCAQNQSCNTKCVDTSCTSTQKACVKADGSTICCSSTQLCDKLSTACIDSSSCPVKKQCGSFCCKDAQYCYDGACVDVLPSPLKCSNWTLVCDISDVCEYTTPLGVSGSVCCNVGEYCANLTGTCCPAATCTVNVNGTLYTECCASSNTCQADRTYGATSGNLCCPSSSVLSYSQTYGRGTATISFNNSCNGICCDDNEETNMTCFNACTEANGTTIQCAIDCAKTDYYACINSGVCCISSRVCYTGTPGGTDPFETMNLTCCEAGSVCGSLPSTDASTQEFLCCPSERQCSIPADGSALTYSCCAVGKECISESYGDMCCQRTPVDKYCTGADDTSAECCTDEQDCISDPDPNTDVKLCCAKSQVLYGECCPSVVCNTDCAVVYNADGYPIGCSGTGECDTGPFCDNCGGTQMVCSGTCCYNSLCIKEAVSQQDVCCGTAPYTEPSYYQCADNSCCPQSRALLDSSEPPLCTECCTLGETSCWTKSAPNTYVCCGSGQCSGSAAKDGSTNKYTCCATGTTVCERGSPTLLTECCSSSTTCADYSYTPSGGSETYCCPNYDSISGGKMYCENIGGSGMSGCCANADCTRPYDGKAYLSENSDCCSNKGGQVCATPSNPVGADVCCMPTATCIDSIGSATIDVCCPAACVDGQYCKLSLWLAPDGAPGAPVCCPDGQKADSDGDAVDDRCCPLGSTPTKNPLGSGETCK